MIFVIGGGRPIYDHWIGAWSTKTFIARVSQAALGWSLVASTVYLTPMRVRIVGRPQCKRRVGRETTIAAQGGICVCYSTSLLGMFVDILPAASPIDVQGAREVTTPPQSA